MAMGKADGASMTPDQLKEIRERAERAERATPGARWKLSEDGEHVRDHEAELLERAARADVPALCAALEEAWRGRDEARALNGRGLQHIAEAERLREERDAARARVKKIETFLRAMEQDATNDLADFKAAETGRMSHNGRATFGTPNAAQTVLKYVREALAEVGDG